MAFRVKSEFQNVTELTTTVNGRRVALNGAYQKTTEAQPNRPAQVISVPAATQADLELLFKQGNPCIEEFETAKEQPVAKNG